MDVTFPNGINQIGVNLGGFCDSYEGTATTSSLDMVALISTISTTTNTVGCLEVLISACTTSGSYYEQEAVYISRYRNTNGVCFLYDNTTKFSNGSYDTNLIVSGTNILVQVVGGSETIEWNAYIWHFSNKFV